MGWGIFDSESVLLEHFVWIVVILLGVYLVNKKPAQTSPPAPLLENK
jgi:hypothetical protein